MGHLCLKKLPTKIQAKPIIHARLIFLDENGEPTFIGDYIGAIASIPAADVVPARRGRWIIHNSLVNGVLLDENEVFVCSACQEQRTRRKYNYCPHCGAKMDGGADK